MTQLGDRLGTRKITSKDGYETTKKIRFKCEHSATILEALRSRGWSQVEGEDESWHLFWCEVTKVREALENRRLDPDQRIPHFRNHWELTRKNLLARNLKRLRRLYLRQGQNDEAEMVECMPITFELPSEYLMFVDEYRKHPGATWIVKPSTGCQGRGIFLFQKIKDLLEWRGAMKKEAANPPATPETDAFQDTYVVQRYVEKPYLLAGRKFDLRIYVLVTSFHPLKAWLAREGFARLSAEQYSLRLIRDNRVHLTNTSVQMRGDSKAIENGCKWSIRRLREYLTARHGPISVDTLMQDIARVVLTSLHSVSSVIAQDRHCFELYGYDILLDKDLKPWLLEVNASPSLAATDPDDGRLKQALLQDTLNIIDLEGRLTGRERRVGGFDLIWDSDAVGVVVPGVGECGEEPRIDTTKINTFLGWGRRAMAGAVLVSGCVLLLLLAWLQPGQGIDCFKCVSENGKYPPCDDPFHNNHSDALLEAPCMGGRKHRDGVFPATACIKLAGVYENGDRITVRGCALDSGTLTTDTEIIRMSHCGAFWFNERYVRGCLQSCDDADACNAATAVSASCLALLATLATLAARRAA